ncbi:MAG: DNA adenine methylase [Promethearchaeota archaeon]|nr:MAG: DNA adenine methylase [Candidatus Lokiarchaeota archaeon]
MPLVLIGNNSSKNLDKDQKSLAEFVDVNNPNLQRDFRAVKRKINQKTKSILDSPYPFLKWAGGKRQLLKQFDQYFPKQFGTYIEPFVGGGTVFFYLLPNKAILLDINEELINCYQVIQNTVEQLIDSLKNHRNEKDYYYKLRNVDRDFQEFQKWSAVQRASRTIFLNRCCFNGLYRVNSKGEFNVPFGRYKNPKFCDEKNLRAVSQVLQGIVIECANFEKCLELAKERDFIYFDPPYQPVSVTANFTSYTKAGFGETAQKKLFEVFQELDKRGCYVMLSNSDSKFILELYGNYKIVEIKAKRAINSDATKRGAINELLILNY